VRWGEARRSEVLWGEVRWGEMRWGEERWEEEVRWEEKKREGIRLEEDRRGEMKWGGVKWDEMRMMRIGEVKGGQNRSSHALLSSDADERECTCSSLYFKYFVLINATLSTFASCLLTSLTRNATA
jgi:hypothetical protein